MLRSLPSAGALVCMLALYVQRELTLKLAKDNFSAELAFEQLERRPRARCLGCGPGGRQSAQPNETRTDRVDHRQARMGILKYRSREDFLIASGIHASTAAAVHGRNHRLRRTIKNAVNSAFGCV